LADKNLQLQKSELRRKELELSDNRGDQVVYTICLLLMLMVAGTAITMFLNYRKANQALKAEQDQSHTLLQVHEQNIRKQRSLLHEISYVQSHEVRGAVATILGLSQLFNTDDYADPDNETVMEGIRSAAYELDGIVKEIITKENNLPE
jgi:signal transduction histidine kinase